MKKLKIYLDTSVISHLDQQDVPTLMADTLTFWKDIKKDIYDVYVSDITILEIDRCYEPKRSFMLKELSEIKYQKIESSKEADILAALYVQQGGLPLSSQNDAKHIAIASINNCNAIISWNFRHIVNLRAMTAVDAVNLKEGHSLLRIVSPSSMLIGKGETK
jgi:predicted nucleic acid-binding protein